MKCRHSWVNYVVRAFLILVFVVGGLTAGEKDDGAIAMVVVGFVLAASIVIDQLTNYLSVDQSFVRGRTGLIKRHTLSSPLNRVDYCEYKSTLIWNTVKIGTGSSVFLFKNVSHGREFVDTVNQYIANK